MASIREVADMAQVSIGTVSRVVNGAENIAPDLRARTLDAIRKLRYTARPARPPKRKRTWNLGLAQVSPESELTENRFTAQSVGWLEQACSQFGYSLIVEMLSDPETPARFLTQGKVDGVIFGEHNGLMPLIPTGIPSCCLFSYLPHIPLPQVCSDDYGTTMVLVEQLLLRGFRRIVFVNPLRLHPGFRQRERGFVDAMFARGLYRPELVIHSEMPLSNQTPTSLPDAVARLRALPELPEVIIAANDWTVLGLGETLQNAGIEPDRDLLLVGFDNLSLDSIRAPQWQFSTVSIPFAEISRQAVRLLDHWITSGEREDGIRFLLGEFIPRGRMNAFKIQ